MGSAVTQPRTGAARPAVGHRRRRWAAATLGVLACVALVLAVAVGYVRRTVVDSDQFANRATAALRDESVRSLIATQVTDQLILKNHSDLIAARPLIQSVVSSAVGGPAFAGAFRAGVGDVHRAVFARDQNTVTLTLGDVATIAAAGLEAVQPSLARRLDTTRRVQVMQRRIGAADGRLVRAAHTITLLGWLLFAAALACAAAAIWLASDRRPAVMRLGWGVAAGGLALAVACDVGRAVAVRSVNGPDARAAVGAVWDAFLGDLHTEAWIVAGCGAVIASAAASLLRPVDIAGPLRHAERVVMAEPSRPALRALRGAAMIAAGLLLLVARDAVLSLLFTLTGVYLIYAGTSALLWLINRPRPAAADAAAQTDGEAAPRRRRRLLVPALAGLVIAAAIAAFLGSGGTTTPAPAAGACNGHAVLCTRTLPEVSLAATHNSMSVPLPGWYSAEQDAPIAEQLRFGIRGLLIDTHYADRLADGRLRTYVGDPADLRRQAEQDGVSPSAVDAALRTRERLGFKGEGKRGLYLCHSFCELGGTPLADVLRDLHDFLVAHPGEVVVVINQDYITPEDFVNAVHDAGLDKLAYRGPTSGRWPTLRQMVDTDQRVLFLAENHAGAAPWYHLAYKSITEETPYAFGKPEELTDPAGLDAGCRPHRGPAQAPLFLVNHWVTTDPVPLPSHAAKVNAYAPLERRLRDCERIRHHIPNLVAVNFYARGDLLRAVDTLNGIRG